ncbi:MAG: hypothetical protein ACLUKE_07195 [Blautia wexlerae]
MDIIKIWMDLHLDISQNYAVVNGRKYYYDVDIEIQNYGKGQGDYYWYKKTLAQAKGNHVFA